MIGQLVITYHRDINQRERLDIYMVTKNNRSTVGNRAKANDHRDKAELSSPMAILYSLVEDADS
ncbi:hypothetical protein ACBQ54_17835 [Providencia vermicola]|uniref:hypothetical protein n=1 Tax=Providencia vermicola TaxID=333965 RepID=UPI003523933D